jgi:hypothetical protein
LQESAIFTGPVKITGNEALFCSFPHFFDALSLPTAGSVNNFVIFCLRGIIIFLFLPKNYVFAIRRIGVPPGEPLRYDRVLGVVVD